MRFRTKLALLGVVLALVAGFAAQAPMAQAQSDTGLVTFLNNTSNSLTFSVDDIGGTCTVGVQYGSCNLRTSVGTHTLIGRRNADGAEVRKTDHVPAAGYTFTVTESKD